MVQPLTDSSFWFIVERAGQIYRFDNDANSNALTPVLDISGQVTVSLEFGLTGFAIHPLYPDDNRVFLLYNDASNSGRSTLSSFEVNTSTQVIDSASETILLTLDQPAQNHNGGDLAFGNDGMLYSAFGDGGYDWEQSLNLSNLHGSLIRIDVDSTPYGIPDTNPYADGQSRCDNFDNARSDNCPEIFAYGFRNPWRFSIDRETGAVWIGDVGEDSAEEVNRVDQESRANGSNSFGWPLMEGFQCFLDRCNTDDFWAALPIAAYDRAGPQSVVGGYVNREANSSLSGKYIFGDIYGGQFYTVDADAPERTDEVAAFTSGGRLITALAQGNDGAVYLLNFETDTTGDSIYRITDSSTLSVSMPDQLSETGCFNTTTKTSASGVFDYEINAPLWSDGARKLRSFAIPDESNISVDADGDFNFPVDSVLIKHFLNGDDYVETRLLVNHSNGWQGYSYEWNETQTDANLLSDGKSVDLGGYTHIFPSTTDCSSCHTSAANTSLGVETAQLNRNSTTNGNNFLETLSDQEYFPARIHPNEEPQLYSLDDDTATIAQRARSYLHSNCSGCHRPGAPSGFMDLRYATDFGDTNTCNIDASMGDLGVDNAQRIAPGNANASTLLLRMETLNANDRMPPLASQVVDEDATQLIRQWINEMSGCD